MIKTKEEILTKIKSIIGENTDDNTLEFLDDVSDTLDDLESRTKDSTNWEQKYHENDDMWRKKYKERFFKGTDEPDEPEKEGLENEINANKRLSYDDLFKTEE